MNKKEFYKQLMLNYTVDAEKIKCNAKRRKAGHSRRVFIRTAGIAAGAAVTAAAVAVVSLGALNTTGLDITETDAESAIERLMAAEQYYTSSFSDTEELMDMYVSFESALKYKEILLAFSAIDNYGDITVDLLYTVDSKYFPPSELTDSELVFAGAKVTAPASLCKEIRLLKTVSLVELAQSGITDDTFIPLGSLQSVTSTAAPFNEPLEITLPGTDEPAETTNEGSESSSTENEPEPSEQTSEPSDEIPAGAVLVPVSDAVLTVDFISTDRIVVTTSDSVRLYRFEDGALQSDTAFYASNAKISWRSDDGTKLFITACDQSARTKLYFADGSSGTLSELDISTITAGGAEISSVICSSDGSAMVLKTVSLDKTSVYFAYRTGNSLIISLVGENDSPVTVLSYSSGIIYTAVTDSESSSVRLTAINTESGAETEIACYSGSLRCIRSNTFDSAALAFTADGAEECVLLTPEGTLIPIESIDITFSETDGSVYTDGEKYFRVSEGEITEISSEEAEAYFNNADIADEPLGDYVIYDGAAYVLAPGE